MCPKPDPFIFLTRCFCNLNNCLIFCFAKIRLILLILKEIHLCICIESQITNDASIFWLATFVKSTCKCWKRKLYRNSTFQFLVFLSMKIIWPLQILMNKIFWYTNANKNGVQKKIGIDNKIIITIKAYNIQKKNTQKTKQTNTPVPPKKQYKEKKKNQKNLACYKVIQITICTCIMY